MTKLLDICKVSHSDPAGDYYFQCRHGVYVGDIASATGIKAEGPDDDWSQYPMVEVDELLRSDIITNVTVEVEDAAGKTFRKQIHYDSDAVGDIKGLLLAVKAWPIGKGTGSPIVNIVTPVRVKSRK